MIRRNRKRFILALILEAVVFTPVHAEQHLVTGFLTDYTGAPVSGASISVMSAVDQVFESTTDADGMFALIVTTATSVETENGSGSGQDILKGIRYHLSSADGTIRIYNVLGRQVQVHRLNTGEHDITLNPVLSSGRYIVMMETPNYRAVSSFTLLNGMLAGTGKTKVLKQESLPVSPVFKKAEQDCELICSKTGYDSLHFSFTLSEQFTDRTDTLRLNLVPNRLTPLPDTLWSGCNLNHYVENDDRGVWCHDNAAILLNEGIITATDYAQPVQTDIRITYSDSVNSVHVITFDAVFQSPVPEQTALVIVCENNNSLGSGSDDTEILFQTYRDLMIPLLSDLFEIVPEAMDGMTLTEIVDVFGEVWQINELVETGSSFYDTIVSLTDETATYGQFVDTLTALADNGYIIDLIFNLHGSYNAVWFTDGGWHIDLLTGVIQTEGIPVRALYQTCCHGSGMIDEWEDIGVSAVTGAVGLNGLAIFSPIYFLENWTGGLTFKESVARAMEMEIDYYTKLSPLIAFYLLTEEVLENSVQQVGGQNTAIWWNDF